MSEYLLHCLAPSGPACDLALLVELPGADRTPHCADFPLCDSLFREDELGIHWRDSHPAIAAWLGRLRALPHRQAPYDLMPGHPRPAA